MMHFLAQIPTDNNPLIPYLGGGLSAVFGTLFWMERKRAEASEARERLTMKETLDAIYKSTGTLQEAITLFKARSDK